MLWSTEMKNAKKLIMIPESKVTIADIIIALSFFMSDNFKEVKGRGSPFTSVKLLIANDASLLGTTVKIFVRAGGRVCLHVSRQSLLKGNAIITHDLCSHNGQ